MSSTSTERGAPMVVAKGVHKSFGHNEVLKGIDLTVSRGEVMTLLGPSGSGKSTFLRLINHLETMTSGRLSVDGAYVGYRESGGKLHELKEAEIAARRAEIGMVFQRFNLFPHMTVLQNVMEAPMGVKGDSRATAQDKANTLLERVGLQDKAKAYPAELSGGQQQRVAIARALAMEPKLMLFDEPTSALDPHLVGEVLDVIKRLAASGMTMLIVTHEVRFARDVADWAAVMADGVIAEQGPAAEILTRPQHPTVQAFLARTLH